VTAFYAPDHNTLRWAFLALGENVAAHNIIQFFMRYFDVMLGQQVLDIFLSEGVI
jgi:hypothetical protein